MPWNLVYHSLFKVDTQNVGVLWYDSINSGAGEAEQAAAAEYVAPRRVLCTSIYNMMRNSWRTIKLVSPGPSPDLLTAYRFGSALVPIFDKHVAIREQVETHKKMQPRADGPIPLVKLLIFGGTTLDDSVFDAAS